MANEKPNLSYSDFYTFNSNPTATVNPAKVGVVWINNKDKKIFICTDNTLNKNKWEETPNMELLEGKVEDALKDLEDMVQEIRTYASGLEYTKQVLIGNKTYSWKHDVELELSPELYIPAYTDVGQGMEMSFYINGKYHPVAYCDLGYGHTINTFTAATAYYNFTYQYHLSAHRASFGIPQYTQHVDSYTGWTRYIRLSATGVHVLRLTTADHVDLDNITEIRTAPYTCNSASTMFSFVNGTSHYGIPLSLLYKGGKYQTGGNFTGSLNALGAHIPWYIYYGGETSLTDYWTKVVSPSKIDKDILMRYKMMYTGVPYTIKLKAGETFRFRVRILQSNAWTGWTTSYLPVGYMAPKQVSYIN